jgi:hypothetical protein
LGLVFLYNKRFFQIQEQQQFCKGSIAKTL